MSREDDILQALVEAHEGLDERASRELDARLALLLADALGDPDRVLELIAEAVRTGRPPPDPSAG